MELLHSRAQRIAAIVAGGMLVGVGFVPQFGGLGYEFSLTCGVVLPMAAAIATALDVSSAPGTPLASVLRGLRYGAALAVLGLVVGLGHGLVSGVCDLWGGVVTYLLTAGAGLMMGGLWGAFAGERAIGRKRRRLACVSVAVLGPLGGIVLSVWRFYASPMVFAYDPFFGFFSGTLYDTVVDAGTGLLTYRLGSLLTVGFAVTLASALRRQEGRVLRVGRRDARLIAALILGVGSLGITLEGPALGHWETPQSIAHELGGARAGARCDVVYPKTLRDDEAALLVKDCDEEIASGEAVLGARGPDRIVAFFFHDAVEKRRLMGAADTYIAKPWRKEVYLQLASYPHPVLGHEIAHVIAGSFGRGPFRIAGEAGGLWPNPGLIEGVAVAASPDQDELTDLEWAAAMKTKGKLPPMQEVFSVDFLKASASKSYTLAGAFVRWLLDTKGSRTVREWYAGASIEALLGEPWPVIDMDFRAALDAVALPPAALEYVDSKFERPSLWQRKCPHVVDALKRGGDACRDTHDLPGARELYAKALSKDPNDWSVLLSLGSMELRDGDVAKGRSILDLIALGDVPLAYKHKASEALADRAYLDGQWDLASGLYQGLADKTPDEDVARNLEVKAMAAKTPDARDAVRALLLGENGRPPDVALASARLGAWEEKTHDPLASYLLGKTTSQRSDPRNAAVFLDRAIQGLDTLSPRVGREAIRQRAIAACATGDVPAKARLRALLSLPTSPFASSAGGRLDGVRRMLDRCLP